MTSIATLVSNAQAALNALEAQQYPVGSTLVTQAMYDLNHALWLQAVFPIQAQAAALQASILATGRNTSADMNTGVVNPAYFKIAGQLIDLTQYTA
ncbi:hypothetical protein [Paraburkholderia sp. GAS348]|uniref:hypothetical protein n=1 Tax=Paraburkholderia sp. GAS348 TaxID=3035132 RepID=UPI003D1F35F8